jgi:spermidine synthase
MKFAFAQVICLPQVHDGNVVAIAFRRERKIDLAALTGRAAQIVADTKLPAKAGSRASPAAK